MKKILLSMFLAALIISGSSSMILAEKTNEVSPSAKMKLSEDKTATDEAEGNMLWEMGEKEDSEINSYELFWPLVAGKTRTEKMYFLKRIKEKTRGALIFGSSQKVDYHVFIAVKRTLETEKLLNEGKKDAASDTLKDAIEELDKAEEKVNDISKKGGNYGQKVHGINTRLENISKLAIFLSMTNDEKLLVDLANKASDLSEKI
ncbi:hypothetical protein IPM62_04575 [Candidatus Woesebacteria bacterium]|nr:MAG: hypothetical protein IPM62_04575 [Candidatus Woesebacteria bacterium]